MRDMKSSIRGIKRHNQAKLAILRTSRSCLIVAHSSCALTGIGQKVRARRAILAQSGGTAITRATSTGDLACEVASIFGYIRSKLS